jgi:hypothetical protein
VAIGAGLRRLKTASAARHRLWLKIFLQALPSQSANRITKGSVMKTRTRGQNKMRNGRQATKDEVGRLPKNTAAKLLHLGLESTSRAPKPGSSGASFPALCPESVVQLCRPAIDCPPQKTEEWMRAGFELAWPIPDEKTIYIYRARQSDLEAADNEVGNGGHAVARVRLNGAGVSGDAVNLGIALSNPSGLHTYIGVGEGGGPHLMNGQPADVRIYQGAQTGDHPPVERLC